MPVKAKTKTNLETIPQTLPEEGDPETLYIGHASEFWKPTLSSSHTIMWQPPAELPHMDAAPICYISDIKDPGEISIFRYPLSIQVFEQVTILNPGVYSFRFPKLTEELHFSQHNFNVLMLPLINLRVFEIHICTLENLNLSRKIGFPNFLNLPKLASLQISSYNFSVDHAPKFKMDKILVNTSCLLSKTFPNLNFLAISLPLVRHKDRELTQAILKCVRTHFRSLKSLNIELTFDVKPQNNDSNTKSTLTDNEELEMDLADSRMVQLHSFHYFSTYRTDSTMFWRNFLQTQVTLEYVQFWCGEKYFPLPSMIILQNSTNLHTIALNINPLLGTKPGVKRSYIDCSVFSKCCSLKTLVLKGKPMDSEFRPLSSSRIPKSADIKNFHHLSRGLECLRLIHLKIHKKDASTIANELPRLGKLYLENAGEEDDFGMGLGDLAILLGKPSKIIHLDIIKGLNKASFKDVRTDEGGFAMVAKLLFQIQSPESFRVSLGLDGQYDTVDDPNFDEDVVVENEVFHENFEGMVTEEELQLKRHSDVVLLPRDSNRQSKKSGRKKQYNVEFLDAKSGDVGVGSSRVISSSKGKFAK